MRSYTTHYRAQRRETLTRALSQAGFGLVTWLMPEESGFYQPIVLAIPQGGAQRKSQLSTSSRQ